MKTAPAVHSFVGMKHAAPEVWAKPSRVIDKEAAIRPNWRKTGCESGPLLVVTGSGVGLDGAIRRLKALPTLGYMRGELSIFDRSSTSEADMSLRLEGLSESETYFRILGAATQLGMISGRGVPQRYLSKAAA